MPVDVAARQAGGTAPSRSRDLPARNPSFPERTRVKCCGRRALKCYGDGVAGCSVEDLVKVGTKPAGNGRWGHADLVGNTYEWVYDGFPDSWPMPCVDCATIETTNLGRTMRSGSYNDPAQNMRTYNRFYAQPTYRWGSGLRCASGGQ